jgi:hypothetical protein
MNHHNFLILLFLLVLSFSCEEGSFEEAEQFINLEFPFDSQVCEIGNHIPNTNQGNFEIEMKWSAKGNFDSFDLVLNKEEPETVSPTEIEGSYVITKQFNYGAGPFSWRIIGKSDGVEFPSPSSTFSTPAISIVEATLGTPDPVIFEAPSFNNNNVRISWRDDVSDNTVIYDAYYHTSQDISDNSANYTGTPKLNLTSKEAEFTINGFNSNTTYYILVVAKFLGGSNNPNQSFSRTAICQFCN